jgi:protocatechuate 3,4-dioxygenase beta subunit
MISTTDTDGMHARENRHRTPDQILGPYFPMGHTPVPQADLTSVNGVDGFAQGEIIEVTGRILNLAAPLDPNFVGCVGVQSDDDGIYRIKTIKPGAYPAGPDWMRPPHIHFEVHGRFERLITQMYFPDEPLNASDRLLNAAMRPDLLIAKPASSADGCDHRVLNFDIVLSRG